MTGKKKPRRRPWQVESLELRLLVAAGLRVIWVRLGTWILPYRIWKKRFVAAPKLHIRKSAITENVEHFIDRCRWATIHASRCFPKSNTCLVHAIVMQRLLARKGLESRIHIGIARNTSGEFGAHAWVTRGDQVIIGEDSVQPVSEQFTHLTTLERKQP